MRDMNEHEESKVTGKPSKSPTEIGEMPLVQTYSGGSVLPNVAARRVAVKVSSISH